MAVGKRRLRRFLRDVMIEHDEELNGELMDEPIDFEGEVESDEEKSPSEMYEESAMAELDSGGPNRDIPESIAVAQVYATLALVAAVRELADIVEVAISDPEDDEEDEEGDDDGE